MRRALEKTRGSDVGILDLMFAELSVDTALGAAYNAILKLVNIEFLRAGSPPEANLQMVD